MPRIKKNAKEIIKNQLEPYKFTLLAFHNSISDFEEYEFNNFVAICSNNKNRSKNFKQIIDTCTFNADILNTTKLLTEGIELKQSNDSTIALFV